MLKGTTVAVWLLIGVAFATIADGAGAERKSAKTSSDEVNDILGIVDRALEEEVRGDIARWSAVAAEDTDSTIPRENRPSPRAEADRLRDLLDQEEKQARSKLDTVKETIGGLRGRKLGDKEKRESAALHATERDLVRELSRIASDRLRLDNVYTAIRKAERKGILPANEDAERKEVGEFAKSVEKERETFRDEIRRDEAAAREAQAQHTNHASKHLQSSSSSSNNNNNNNNNNKQQQAAGRADSNLAAIAATHAALDRNEKDYKDIKVKLDRYRSEIKRIEGELAEELVAMDSEKRDLAKVLSESRRIADAIRTNAEQRDKERRELNGLRWAVVFELCVGAVVLAIVVCGGFFRSLCGKKGDNAGYTPIGTSSNGMLMDDIGDNDL